MDFAFIKQHAGDSCSYRLSLL